MNKLKDLTPRVFIVYSEKDIYSLLEGINNHHQIIINLTNLSTKEKYRIIDFLSGYIYAKNGSREKLEDNIYSFSIN